MGADSRFADAVYAVEANDFERHALWREWHESLKWEQDLRGYFGQVGEFGGMPVTICGNWARIEGRLVCFYFSPSKVVHHDMVRAWLTERCNPQWNGGQAHCDGAEFGNRCVCALRQMASAAEKP